MKPLLTLLICLTSLFAAPQSWRDIANEALFKGDRKTAAEFYRKWAEADPTDAISLYNLACCYALEDSFDLGMRALKQAAEAGWSDSVHTSLDPDLERLRARPEFAKALDKIAHNARMKYSGYTAHVCKQERAGQYIVVLPDEYDPGKAYPLAILLHNHGSAPERAARVIPWIDSHRYIFAIPQGAYTAAQTDGKGFSHLREREDFSEDLRSAGDAADWVVHVADDMRRRYPLTDSTFVVIGMSQGGALAHLVTARYPQRIKRCAVYGGYLFPESMREADVKREQESGTSILMVHDQKDPAVEFAEAVYAKAMYDHFGVKCVLTPLDGAGHNLTQEAGKIIGDWLANP